MNIVKRNPQLIDTLKFRSSVVREFSSTPKPTDLGTHTCTMELHKIDEDRYFIEWDIPTLEECLEIGIWLCNGELVDYDGVFSLPKQAVELLRKNDILVPEDMT